MKDILACKIPCIKQCLSKIADIISDIAISDIHAIAVAKLDILFS